MSEEKKIIEEEKSNEPEEKKPAGLGIETEKKTGEVKKNDFSPERKFSEKRTGGSQGRKMKKNRKGDREREDRKDEFEQRVLDIARVTRVMAGGKRMNFRACVAIGDGKNRVGVGLGKGADVTMAVNKAVNKAKKNLVEVPTVNETIPHEIYSKAGAAKILFKPARRGRGVIAGGVVRTILELAGVHNVSAKILGTNNKINNAICTIEALKKIKRVERQSPLEPSQERGKRGGESKKEEAGGERNLKNSKENQK
ncbi:MAG: 30S ribosomal protein S5 [Patescibacteria group bacterium]|nr:30S ribosomal protein S5 [Patescibacteria group bacterium]